MDYVKSTSDHASAVLFLSFSMPTKFHKCFSVNLPNQFYCRKQIDSICWTLHVYVFSGNVTDISDSLDFTTGCKRLLNFSVKKKTTDN